MVAAFPPWLHSFTQPHLVTTQCSHSFAFLATEQLNWSNWGFSASSKGTSTVAAEGWENISHSFKPASPPKPASLTFRQAQFLICVLAGTSSVEPSNKHKHKPRMNWWLNVPQCEIYYILVTVMFVDASSVAAAQIEKWAPSRLHSCYSGAFPNIYMWKPKQIGYDVL